MALDLASLSAGATAVKTGFDVIKIGLGLAKEAKDLLPSGEHKDKVTETLEVASKKIAEGEAAVAHGLGYNLCRCEYPPTPRLLVGYIPYHHMNLMDRQAVMKKNTGVTSGVEVHECPRCGTSDAPGYNFQRTVLRA